MKNGPQVFEQFSLRTPLLSIDVLSNLLISENFYVDLQKTLSLKVVREAIYVASKDFYEVLRPVIETGFDPENKNHVKLARSGLAYITRMCSRCTPFGLFAGISMGTFSNITNLKIKDASFNKRITRVDMGILCELINWEVSERPYISDAKFFTNSSLYRTNTEYRYIEPVYTSDSISHELRGLNPTMHLETCIELFRQGITLEKAKYFLLNLGYESQKIKEFFCLLINSKVIISELIPGVLGANGVPQIIDVLKNIDKSNSLSLKLENTVKDISRLDKIIGNSISSYTKIENGLKENLTSLNTGSNFNVTMYSEFSNIELEYAVKRKIYRTYDVLSALSIEYVNKNMLEFVGQFKKRYDKRKVRLVDVLDVDIGLGYPFGGIVPPLESDFFEKIGVPLKKLNKNNKLELNRRDIYFSKILNNRVKSNVLEITDLDLNKIRDKKNSIPSLTFNCKAKLIKLDEEVFIEASFMGGSSASTLLGRFAVGNQEITNFVSLIAEYEQKQSPNVILAEIGHFPGGRIGNVLFRENPREHTISYLDGGTIPHNNISIEDILVYIENGKVKLWHSNKNKEIIPYLGNAHNYFKSKLPIYRFLCDAQYARTQRTISFNWGSLLQLYSFLPRLVYKDVILKRAMWKLDECDLQKILKCKHDDNRLQCFNSWKQASNLPNSVLWVEGENSLEINTQNKHSLLMFLDRIKTKDCVWLEESFLNTDGFVKNSEGKDFSNEFIFHLKR